MSGAADMESRLRDALSQLRERGKSAVLSEGGRIMQRSNDEFAPKRTGALIEDSGVELVDTDDNSIEVVLWYGKDKAKDYAIPTHETPSKHDPPSWKGVAVEFRHGQAKYLERPLRDAVKGMAERLAKDIGTLVLVGFLVSGVGVSSAQVSGISAKAFPQQITVSRLPIPDGTQGIRIVTNALSDSDCTVGGGSNKLICFDNGSWTVIGQGGSGSDDQTASEVSITDTGSFYSGSNVESALQEIGADSRWSDARTPLAHTQAASTITDFTSASQAVGDARYSLLGHTHVSSNVTDFTTSVQTVGDARYSLLAHLHNLQDLSGAVTDLQVPDTITLSGTPERCARYDVSGNLVPSSGDCPSGDTTGTTAPGGLDTQVQLNSLGSFGGHSGLVYSSADSILTVAGRVKSQKFESVSGAVEITGTGRIYFQPNGPGTGAAAYFNSDGELSLPTLTIGGSTSKIAGSGSTLVLRDAVRLPPLASPPVTCGSANTEGVIYQDSSHALCVCDGTAWTNLTPASGGSCA